MTDLTADELDELAAWAQSLTSLRITAAIAMARQSLKLREKLDEAEGLLYDSQQDLIDEGIRLEGARKMREALREELRALVGQGRAIVEGKVVDPPGRVVSDGNVLDGGTTETVE